MGYTQKYTIVKDRVDIYKDFTINLLRYIDKYYLDGNTLKDDTDIHNHYQFCYRKTCDDFLKEDIDFTENELLQEYFYTSYYYPLVYALGESTLDVNDHIKFWSEVFDIDKQDNKSILNIFIEIYRIFDKSISGEKNILELV